MCTVPACFRYNSVNLTKITEVDCCQKGYPNYKLNHFNVEKLQDLLKSQCI